MIDITNETEPNISMSYSDGTLTISGLDHPSILLWASYTDSNLTNLKTQSVENETYNISAKPGDKLFLWDSLAIAFSSGVDSTFC